MEIARLLSIIRRRIWVVVAVVAVTMAVMAVRVLGAPPVYQATVKLQLTTPPQEDVMLYDRYRAIDARDELTVVRNNFTEVLRSREVAQRTEAALQLSGDDAYYELEIRPIRDADFLFVTFSARTAQLAAAIARAHIESAVGYYGEIRAQPTAAARQYVLEELRAAEEQLRAASAAFSEFKIRNAIATIDGEVAILHSALDQLEGERNQRLIEGPTSWEIQNTEALIEQLSIERERAAAEGRPEAAERLDQAIASNRAALLELRETTSATANVDGIIRERREQLARLVMLEPTYDELEAAELQARSAYELLRTKLTEATLKEETVRRATAIQIVEPAIEPSRPASSKQGTLLALAFVGSLGVGLMLALALDSVGGLGTRLLLGSPVPLFRPGEPRAAPNGRHRPASSNGLHKPQAPAEAPPSKGRTRARSR